MPKIKPIAISNFARSALAWPARILFPPVCAGCRRHVSQPGVLCGACWPKLRLLERPWCPVMGTPFTHHMGEGFLSAEAIADPPPFERARAAVAYSGVARQMVQGLKYQDRTDLAPWMARWMVRAGADLIAEAEDAGTDAIVLIHDRDVPVAELSALKAAFVRDGARVRLEQRTKNMKALLERSAADGYRSFATVSAGAARDDLEIKPLS